MQNDCDYCDSADELAAFLGNIGPLLQALFAAGIHDADAFNRYRGDRGRMSEAAKGHKQAQEKLEACIRDLPEFLFDAARKLEDAGETGTELRARGFTLQVLLGGL